MSVVISTDTPTVSIIIPCYNYSQYLGEAIESAIDQTLPANQIIVVNDGSTDNSAQIAARYASNHPSIEVINQTNQGLSAASNSGIRATNSKFFVRLDADDRLDPRFLECTIPLLEAHPRRGYVYTSYQNFGARTDVVEAKRFSLNRLTFRPDIVSTALMRRSAYDDAGEYSLEMRRSYEDWDLYLSMAEHGWYGLATLDVLFYYRRRPGTMSHISIVEWLRLLHQIYHRHQGLYREPFSRLLGRAVLDRGARRLRNLGS